MRCHVKPVGLCNRPCTMAGLLDLQMKFLKHLPMLAFCKPSSDRGSHPGYTGLCPLFRTCGFPGRDTGASGVVCRRARCPNSSLPSSKFHLHEMLLNPSRQLLLLCSIKPVRQISFPKLFLHNKIPPSLCFRKPTAP